VTRVVFAKTGSLDLATSTRHMVMFWNFGKVTLTLRATMSVEIVKWLYALDDSCLFLRRIFLCVLIRH